MKGLFLYEHGLKAPRRLAGLPLAELKSVADACGVDMEILSRFDELPAGEGFFPVILAHANEGELARLWSLLEREEWPQGVVIELSTSPVDPIACIMKPSSVSNWLHLRGVVNGAGELDWLRTILNLSFTALTTACRRNDFGPSGLPEIFRPQFSSDISATLNLLRSLLQEVESAAARELAPSDPAAQAMATLVAAARSEEWWNETLPLGWDAELRSGH